MNASLAQLSQDVSTATSLEALTRPLLEMLHAATGLESTYLTSIDLDGGSQRIQFASNRGELDIPEGLSVPWSDTLCKRALDEGRGFCDDVAAAWADSEAAAALGIKTYASAAVRTSSGLLVGTLCAAGRERAGFDDRARSSLNLFAKLVAQHVEREMLVQQLQVANHRLLAFALSDPLTGLPNRRAILDELTRMIARAAREGSGLLVGVIDLDGFKKINDTHGHQAGDRFLQEFGRRLGSGVRATDMVGRLGGDEFVVIGPGPGAPADAHNAAQALRRRVATSTVGRYELGELAFDYAGASVGVVSLQPGLDAEEALRQADAAMYADKRSRKALH